MSYPTVTHVLFDMDGLLLDTERLYMEAQNSILKRYGKQITWDIKQKLLGRRDLDEAGIIIKSLDIPLTPAELVEEEYQVYPTILGKADLMPGAEKLVKHLYDKKVPMAIATSSSLNNYEIKRDAHPQFFAMFDLVVTASDPELKNGKPEPDIFLICRNRFPVPPLSQQCLVFEDAPAGVTAAIAADMPVVMVPPAYLPKEQTLDATVVLPSLLEFKPEAFGLPKYPR